MNYSRIFNMCTGVNECDRTQGCPDTVKCKSLHWKLTLGVGKKILCCIGELNLCQQHASPMLYQLSYIPIPQWTVTVTSGQNTSHLMTVTSGQNTSHLLTVTSGQNTSHLLTVTSGQNTSHLLTVTSGQNTSHLLTVTSGQKTSHLLTVTSGQNTSHLLN